MMVLFVDAWNKAMEEAHDFDTHARHQHEAQLCQEREQEQSDTPLLQETTEPPKGSFSSLSFLLATVVQGEKEVTRVSGDDSAGPFPLRRPVRRWRWRWTGELAC
jgi:hypothetical protein